MKRWFHLGAASLAAAAIWGAYALGGIEGSKHDFTSKDWSGGDLCAACHTPHRHEPPRAAPLWQPAADLTRRFGSAIGGPGGPALGTLMCMRCHDGTLARDTLGGLKQSRFLNVSNPAIFTTGHGTNDHPVNVEYPQFDRGYRPLNFVTAAGLIPVPDGRIQCSSCHEPHDAQDQPYMLVMSNARSALCLTCHDK